MDANGNLDPDKGLWLWGNIGTGKTSMLEIVRRFCAEVRPLNRKGFRYSFRLSNTTSVASDYMRMGGQGLESYVESGRQAFDELGREPIPAKYFGTELNVMQFVLQLRYENRRNAFTHVTTNCGMDDIKALYGVHILDRLGQMFNFVRFEGASFRKSQIKP